MQSPARCVRLQRELAAPPDTAAGQMPAVPLCSAGYDGKNCQARGADILPFAGAY